MSDMLSQDEINELLKDNPSSTDFLTEERKNVLNEVGNISMSTSASTLSTLLNRNVDVSGPEVSMIDVKSLSSRYDRPCVGIRITYKEGIVGANVLILKQDDVKIISSLMMGGDGTIDHEAPLNDIELSAISEAMNQMIGSSATSLSSMLGYKIDINTPEAFIVEFEDDSFFENIDLGGDIVVSNSFKMVVEGLIDSEIMQLFSMEFSERLFTQLKEKKEAENLPNNNSNINQGSNLENNQVNNQLNSQPLNNLNQNSFDNSAQVNMGQNMNTNNNVQNNNINVKPAQFQSFDINSLNQQKENITIIRDVPLEVTVELGRTKKTIKEILEFNPGTVVELDKIAGEYVDILVNGKFVAKGEVVVIDENFGVRIRDIINIEERI